MSEAAVFRAGASRAAEAARMAEAKVLAATLTLMGRELAGQAPPLSLWTGLPNAADVRETALAVAAGRAEVLWAEDSHPAQGLMLSRPQDLEAALLGRCSRRLSGPWMVEPDAELRYKKTRTLAKKAADSVRGRGGGFLSVKTWHDPAVLRGFADEGFQLAEILACLEGAPEPGPEDGGRSRAAQGTSMRRPHPWELDEWLLSLGDLFYDGHLLHGPYFGPEIQRRLWQELAALDLKKNQPVLFLFQDRPEKLLGLAWGRAAGGAGSLMAVHVVEERRGLGLGSHMLDHLWRRMSVMGARTLAVETASWNTPAQALYRSFGLRHKAPLAALHLLSE
ncbi:MAG: GNAT family N-acetyltransferase [Deltaproteobacteria bacterium]|nr:GNAT family N-acetyltransferase [Deltaproteobacteria bacterium]